MEKPLKTSPTVSKVSQLLPCRRALCAFFFKELAFSFSGKKKKLGKNPFVDTEFLPDREREEEERKIREQLAIEWEKEQERLKSKHPVTRVESRKQRECAEQQWGGRKTQHIAAQLICYLLRFR